MRGWLWESRGYRDVWLLLSTGLALWAVIATLSAASETHGSLCALRADLKRRVDTSRTFLRAHPDGAFGFTPAVIEKGIRDQQRTIYALRRLDCS